MRVRSLVAGAALLLAAGCGSEGGTATSVEVPSNLVTGCPDPSTPLRFPEGDLRTGATRVRLCPGPPLVATDGSDVAAAEVQGPDDLLTQGVGELVALVNRQDEVDGEQMCDGDAGPELVYWFGYRGDEWRAVQHSSYGCDLLQVGARILRLGGDELSLAFTDALLAERATEPPPATPPEARCLAPHTPRTGLVSADLALASATLCVSPRPDTVRTAPLPPELLVRVDAELWPGVAERTRWPCRTGGSEWIEGVTAWGDRVAWGIDACGRLDPLHGAQLLPHERGYLSPELDAALAALPLGPSEPL
jgi:hypothetical protein